MFTMRHRKYMHNYPEIGPEISLLGNYANCMRNSNFSDAFENLQKG